MNDKIKYVYFDLDGTLLNSMKEISPKTLRAIKTLKSGNIKIGIATGRPSYMCKKIIGIINPDLPTIANNGAVIAYIENKKQKIISEIPKDSSIKIYKYLKENNINFLVYTQKTMFYNYPVKPNAWIDRINKMLVDYDEKHKWDYRKSSLKNISENKILKFLVMSSGLSQFTIDNLNKFLKAILGIYVVKSQKKLMDIMPLSADKGNAIKEVQKEDYLDTNKLIVFGDAPNDLTMFESARVAVAMGNADIKIKSRANYIADSNDDEGLFKFVNKLKNNDFKI